MPLGASGETSRAGPPGIRTHLLALGGLLLLAFLVYHPGLSRAAPTPEDYYFYGQVPSSPGELAGRYLELRSEWYRPSSFYLTYFVLQHFLDWHAVALWKLVNLLTLVSAAFALYLLILRLGGRDLPAAVLGSVFFLTHPAVILPLYEVTAFDFLHLSAATLVVVSYAAALEAQGWRRRILLTLALLLYVFALTLKEVCYPLPLFLAALEFTRGGRAAAGESALRRRLAGAGRLLPFFAMFAAYTWLHVLNLPPRPRESAYRTGLNLAMVQENLQSFSLWMMRIFREHSIRAGWIRRITNGFSVILMALALGKVVADLWLRRRERWPSYREGLIWLLVFLVIPLYSGYYLHHILLPLFGLCLIASRAWSSLIRSLPGPRSQATSGAA